MSTLRHRSEIDGLRAVAVTPVLLFHARLGVNGGFVGVDVFFVISGFLITSLILREAAQFSLVDFWERRVRRILPALSVMLLGCVVAGWFTLFPDDFAQFGRSLVAESLLLANVFFWRGTDYFAIDAVRPLLHVWSLAVEEQFYLFFPVLLFALKRAPRRLTQWVIAVLTVMSFALSVYGVSRHPSPTFFLLPPRAWELAVGALLATAPEARLTKQWLNELLSALGLAAILGACWWYDDSTPFPGAAALLPCLGTLAIIFSSTGGKTWIAKALSLKPVVALGLVSYSLYLWHWPVLTLARYAWGAPSPPQSVGLLLLSAFLAFLSWKFVELPVRQRVVLARRVPLFVVAAAVTGAFLVSGVVIARARGIPGRWSSEALAYASQKSDSDFRVEVGLDSIKSGQLVELGDRDPRQPVDLLVWGDSHAMAVLHVINVLCREHHARCLGATHSATMPLLGIPGDGRFSMGPLAQEYNQGVVDLVGRLNVRNVLLVAAWAGNAEAAPEQWHAALLATMAALHQTGANVVIMADVPYPNFEVPIALAQAVSSGRNASELGIAVASYRTKNAQVNAQFAKLGPGGVAVLDPTDVFCDARLCHVAKNGHALYFDHHHLSTYGALQLKSLFEPLFESTRSPSPTAIPPP